MSTYPLQRDHRIDWNSFLWLFVAKRADEKRDARKIEKVFKTSKIYHFKCSHRNLFRNKELSTSKHFSHFKHLQRRKKKESFDSWKFIYALSNEIRKEETFLLFIFISFVAKKVRQSETEFYVELLKLSRHFCSIENCEEST